MFKRLKLYLIMASLLSFVTPAIGQQSRTLTLDEIYSLAESNSTAIDAERIALDVANATIEEAKSGRLPDIDLSLSASYLGNGTLTDRNLSNSMGVKIPHFGNNFAVEAAQLIYGGGAVNNSIAMARLEADMATINLDATRSRVRFMLTGFYLELYKLHNIVDVYDKNIHLAEELIADTRARNREGIALSNDITRQELRLQNLLLARTEVINSIDILSTRLATIIGLDPATEIIPADATLEYSLPMNDETYWQEIAANESYDLKRADVAIEMGERAEQLARSERRPSVALVAANHFDGPITIEVPVIDKNFNYWYVGVGVSFKIGSLYKTNRTIKRQEIATEHSRRQRDEVEEQTMLSVHADYVRYVEAFETERTLQKSVELAQSNYNVIDTRYRNDIVLVTDMTDAANQLLNAELQLTNARINIIMRYFTLLNTAGEL